ncbi:hypothetical protein [Ruegeria sp. Ofav3-42]|uniref:hypothetical protein n=1 Tax=Ruegeria sp. Ofav3-42 TaxID=2917759 RepID=UPI001EF6F3F7|nr:hypothetical protein [Ruegeria sp. Ofav3-42]MCG7522090.1 hypothetical protein [Ruegeria sp. Ofav3-42]
MSFPLTETLSATLKATSFAWAVPAGNANDTSAAPMRSAAVLQAMHPTRFAGFISRFIHSPHFVAV